MLAGVALAVLAVAGAHAQEKAPASAPSADGLQPDELYMEADLVVRDDAHKTITARGDVEVRYNGRTLRAQELVYDEGRGVITARGDVQTISADGTVEYADEVTLDDEMKAGVATGFSTRMQDNAKLAAASAIRRSDTVNELNQAIYTPCELCVNDKPKKPSWSIKADKVVEDRDRQIVYYRNAVIQVLGVPVLYLPVFWHPDPEATRKSGLLPPTISASNRRGFSYQQPYLIVLSPYSDLTLSPQINSKVNPFLNGHYRKRFYSGQIDARFGYTYDRDFDSSGDPFGDRTSRSYLLASGAFRIDDKWRWGFTAERASDDYIFDKYEVGNVYHARGPYLTDDRRLISQIYSVRQDERSYLSIAAFSIQGLRPTDVDRTFPLVAPLIEARWEPQRNVLGGRLRVNASAVALTRDQSSEDLTQRLPGLDSRRATGGLDWRSSYTSQIGVRVDPFVNVRADAYSLSDLPTGGSKTTSRALAVAGADITYPLYRRFGDSTVVLEPVMQVAVSPSAKQITYVDYSGATVYLDEDSRSFEFDETTLFRADKFPGFDLYEDGARLNVGARASVLWDDGRRAEFLVGRSFRDAVNSVFPARTGLQPRASDWIVAAEAQPMKGLSVFSRVRLDSDSLDVERAEAGANFALKRASGYFRYLRDDSNVNGVKTENLDLGTEVPIGQHWGVTASGSLDLEQSAWIVRNLGVFYHDDCLRVDIIYRREDTVVGRLGPSDSIAFRLTLATLGEAINAN
ncbi:LPS-assembly protein LptD [Phenylobacterium sp.]|uniref:LPS-assembly protein LptD n=1 Tax=Phenylobacterium sp. TaxID=1871053 RepID=UPI0035ADAF7A